MLKPSLYAMYKQGRFRKPGFEATEEGMKQIERFAVSMLAFALEQELVFRKDFLRQVCERSRTDDAQEFLLELEVANCGDLILRKQDDSEAYAFEFKIDSPVQFRNQHPTNPEFFRTGYGAGIRSQPWKKSTYILVKNDPENFNKPAQPIPICRGVSWRDLYKCNCERPLIRDLFESFGSLGIPAFIHMNTKDISLGRHNSTLDAVKLYKLLHAVAGRIASKRTKLDVDLDSDKKGGYIGMNFLPTANVEEWQKLVQPKDNVVGWFGYSQYKKSTLDVWFYCGNPKASERVRALLPKHFSQLKPPSDAKNYVWISSGAENSADNQE